MKQIILNNPQGGRSATKRTKTDQWCVQAKTSRVQTNATNAKNPRRRRGLTKRTEADQWFWVQTKTNLAQGSTNQPAPNGGQQEMRGGDKIKSGSGSRVRRSFQANREMKARAARSLKWEDSKSFFLNLMGPSLWVPTSFMVMPIALARHRFWSLEQARHHSGVKFAPARQ